MGKRKFNFELMERIIAQIEADPSKFEMGSWLSLSPAAMRTTGGQIPNINPVTTCGTTGCVAGWAVALSYPKVKIPIYCSSGGVPNVGNVSTRKNAKAFHISDKGRQLLGISEEESEMLFSGSMWPQPYGSEMIALTTNFNSWMYDLYRATIHKDEPKKTAILANLKSNQERQAAIAVQYLREFVQQKMGELV